MCCYNTAINMIENFLFIISYLLSDTMVDTDEKHLLSKKFKIHRYKCVFRSAILFSDVFVLTQPKTDIHGLSKLKNLHAARFAGNIKTCAYDISQKLHFDDLWKKLSPTLKGLVIKYCYLLNKSACWKHLYFQIQFQ